jgi:stage III sporulation protein AH
MVYMKILKRNQIVVAVIALMLVTAGYLNFANQNKESNLIPTSSAADSELMAGIGDAQLVSANETKENNQTQNETVENTENVATTNKTKEDTASNITQNTSAQEDSYFAQSRLDRDKMYSQMLDNYQKILETNNLSSEEKKTAQEEIKRINNEKNAIMIAENLIKTKGFQDIVIFVNNGNVTGVVQKDKLDEKDIAQIQNIITRELNVKTNKINISGKN